MVMNEESKEQPVIMNIAYTCSDSYARFVGVSILSLFENNEDADAVNVYIIDMDISMENKLRLHEIAKQYRRNLVLIEGKERIEKLQQRFSLADFHGNINSYAKIYPQDFLPDIDRVLFIDADTIVLGSLTELYTMDLGEAIFAGVPDVGVYFFGHEDMDIVNKNFIYYNSGMLLYNMRQVVSKDLAGKIAAALGSYSSPLRLADQSLINYAIDDEDALRVHFMYNNYVHTVPKAVFTEFSPAERFTWYQGVAREIVEARKQPKIVHFVRGIRMGGRPWLTWNTSYFSRSYLKYRRQLPEPWNKEKRESNIRETRHWRKACRDGVVNVPVIGQIYIVLWIVLSKYLTQKNWLRYQDVLQKAKHAFKKLFRRT